MNRSERRTAAAINRKQARAMWPSGYVDCDDSTGLADGQTFKVTGVRRLRSGKIITNCEPGTETRWIARHIQQAANK